MTIRTVVFALVMLWCWFVAVWAALACFGLAEEPAPSPWMLAPMAACAALWCLEVCFPEIDLRSQLRAGKVRDAAEAPD
jgi:hypothetical protein